MIDDQSPFLGKIAATTDFSPTSTLAFPYALDEARASKSDLTVIHAVEDPVPMIPLGDYMFPIENIDEIRASILKGAEKNLDTILEKYLPKTSVAKNVLRGEGSIGDIITDYVIWEDIGLVVMASQGHSFFGRVLLGSVTEEVLRGMRCPVLVIPGGEGGKSRSFAPYKNILVTTDFSLASSAAFPFAKYEAKRTGASLHVMHINESPFAPELLNATLKEDLEEIQNSYERGLQNRVNELVREFDLDGTKGLVIEKSFTVPNSIHRYAEEQKIDLIVIATQGMRSRLGILGGVVERLVREAPCPVLVVPSRPRERK